MKVTATITSAMAMLLVAAITAVLILALAACGSAGSLAPRAAGTMAAVPPSAEVIAGDLHLHGIVAYTAATDPDHLLGRQGEYTSKVNWGPAGQLWSSIEVFPAAADAAAREQYVSSFPPPIGDGYDFLAGAALLRLADSYTPTQARALEAAFRKAATA